MKGLVALAALAACGQSSSEEAAATPGSAAARMSPAEVQRASDACKAYVDRACACAKTVPAAKAACDGAHALPESIKTALEVAASPDSSADDVRHTQRFVRDTVAECIEQTAKLPQLGCAP
jgi:hypothetical protein